MNIDGMNLQETKVSISPNRQTASDRMLQADSTDQQQKGREASATQSDVDQIDMNALRSMMDEVNKSDLGQKLNVQFQIDEPTGKTILQIKDRSTDELIRQVPTEEILAISAKLKELAEMSAGKVEQTPGLIVEQQA